MRLILSGIAAAICAAFIVQSSVAAPPQTHLSSDGAERGGRVGQFD